MYIQTITYLHYALARSGPNLDLFFVWQSDAPPPLLRKLQIALILCTTEKGLNRRW